MHKVLGANDSLTIHSDMIYRPPRSLFRVKCGGQELDQNKSLFPSGLKYKWNNLMVPVHIYLIAIHWYSVKHAHGS